MGKVYSAEDFQSLSGFEEIRKELLKKKYADRLDKQIAFWALPGDRRLPVALLGRRLRELLATTYEDLASTPGIGRKKMHSLVALMQRATVVEPSRGLLDANATAAGGGISLDPEDQSHFDPNSVSEAMWGHWCETVRCHGLEHQTLGRLAPSLLKLPTVIWEHTLGMFVEHSLSDIREMKTYGEKRIEVILEIFFLVDQLLKSVEQRHHLAVRVLPRFIIPIEVWISLFLENENIPGYTEVVQRLAIPLLEQVRLDAGDSIADLARERLGIEGEIHTVRQQAELMGMTRARVYQILDECAVVMRVRWPEGRHLLTQATNCAARYPGTKRAELFRSAVNLFYPERSGQGQEGD